MKDKSQSKNNSSNEKSEPLPKPLSSVVIRNEFYRDRYRTLVRIAFMQSIALVAMIFLFFAYQATHQAERTYFATTEDGRLVPMVPLSQPNLSKPALLSWATQAATEVMTFGFNDYRRRLQESSRHFTKEGWVSFTQALQQADFIAGVSENRQAISAAPRGAPILISEGVVNGVYQWQIRLPMLVQTVFGSQSRSDSWVVNLIIVRVPTLESPNGVGIQQWIASGG